MKTRFKQGLIALAQGCPNIKVIDLNSTKIYNFPEFHKSDQKDNRFNDVLKVNHEHLSRRF